MLNKKFIFVKDVEALIKQGKTEMQVPDTSRFSPAAWDLVREKSIKLSFKAQPLQAHAGIAARGSQRQSANHAVVTPEPALVAVASETREPSGTVGRFAGRSPYFLVFDFKGRFIDIIKNPYSNESEGIGRRVADLLAASQVSVFVAEQFGQKLIDALTDHNVKYFELSGPIEEAIKTVFDKKGGDTAVPSH